MDRKKNLKNYLKEMLGEELPISGGWGNSIDDPITIDKDIKDWSEVEYKCLKLINLIQGRKWKLVRATLIEENGRFLNQIKIEVSGENEVYYNYYFDVTDHMKIS